MEEFQAQGYTYTELAKLNCCRMYLKVLSLVDVVTGKGKFFTEHFSCQREQ